MHTAQLTKQFPAPPDRVFRALTTPEDLVRWWGPRATAEVDLRPGGVFRLGMRLPGDMSLVALGTYKEINSPVRLVFAWAWEDDPGAETLVSMELHDQGAETELTLTHSLNPTPEAAANHHQGWSDCLDRLVAMLMTP